ncbi:hypothetical protein J7J63_06135 [Candidatus Bipolaricaulota bacterium]|jgi:hypothetical protein|nr:hypothetical protein [Candidatus Bipolaricaulota bacterium]
MKETVQKLVKVERELSLEKGAFTLFALVLREDTPDFWDLLVAAPWIEVNKEDAIKYIATKVKKALTPQELMMLSRIVVIEQDNPFLEALHQAAQVEHGLMEVQHSIFFGLPIEHAYIIASQRTEKATQAASN